MVKFTQAQERAITAKGSDILVSAAAGSGKTAVLVERIKQNIIDGNYSIDEVFVSTFTNKSAKDMKDKIEKALRETYNETMEPRLNEEIIKLNDAHISTLHRDRKSTRLNSSHVSISYAVFCLKKKTTKIKYTNIKKKKE